MVGQVRCDLGGKPSCAWLVGPEKNELLAQVFFSAIAMHASLVGWGHITRCGMMVMMDVWSCGLARGSTMDIFVVAKTGGCCFRCFFATLFALFTLLDADLRLTPKNVCCCSFSNPNCRCKNRVHMWTLPYYAE